MPLVKTRSLVVQCAALLAVMLGSAACRDTTAPLRIDPGPDANSVAIYNCAVTVRSGELMCSHVGPISNVGLRRSILGAGQVRLASTNVHWDSVTQVLYADITVQNLMTQPIGTTDGTTMTGMKVFFNTGPTVTAFYVPGDTGSVTMRNADGFDFFSAPRQPYFSYPQILVPNEVSAPKTWLWNVPRQVKTFTFSLQVFTTRPADTGAVRLDYICGNTFRLQSFNDSVVSVSYTVRGNSETRTLKLAPRPRGAAVSEYYFATTQAGTVDITRSGTVVSSRPNTTATCAEPVYLTATGLSADTATLHVNPNDPVMLTRPLGGGEVVQYIAEKDSLGNPGRLTAVVRFNVNDPDHRDVMWFAANSMPSSAILRDSSQMTFDYLPGDSVRMTMRLPDGTQHINYSTLGGAVVLQRTAPARSGATRAISGSGIEFPRRVTTSLPVHYVDVFVSTGMPSSSVPVSNANVQAHWEYETDEYADVPGGTSGELSLVPHGGGHYVGRLEVGQAETTMEDARSQCRQVNLTLQAACDGLSQSALLDVVVLGVCTAMATSANPVIRRFGIACDAILILGKLVCATHDYCETIGMIFNIGILQDSRLKLFVTVGGDGYGPRGVVKTYPGSLPEQMPVEVLLEPIVKQRIDPYPPQRGSDFFAITELVPAVDGIEINSWVEYPGMAVMEHFPGYTNMYGRYDIRVPWKSCATSEPMSMLRSANRNVRTTRRSIASISGDYSVTMKFVSWIGESDEHVTYFTAPIDPACVGTHIEITPTVHNLAPGASITVHASVVIDGVLQTNPQVEWNSDDPTIATVHSTGGSNASISGVNPGLARISASFGEAAETVPVVVQNRNIVGTWTGTGSCAQSVVVTINANYTFWVSLDGHPGDVLDGVLTDDGTGTVELKKDGDSYKYFFWLSNTGNELTGERWAGPPQWNDWSVTCNYSLTRSS